MKDRSTLLRNVLTALASLAAGPVLLAAAASDGTRSMLRQTILAGINHDRGLHGLSPVQLDPHASEMADRFCRTQVSERTSGHFTTDGKPPYMRYSLSGGSDGLSQNTAAWSANYEFSEEALPGLVRESQREMMDELPPNDGHRRAILDPYATHVGIGVAWEGGELRLAQEFIRRYVEWKRPLPRSTSIDKRPLATGKPREGYRVSAITVHFEQPPKAMSPALVSRIESYSLPSRRRDYWPRLINLHWHPPGEVCRDTVRYADGSPGDFTVERDGSFSFAIPLEDGPGVYTVVVWVQPEGSEEVISASNVSIEVGPTGSARAR